MSCKGKLTEEKTEGAQVSTVIAGAPELFDHDCESGQFEEQNQVTR